MPTAPEALESGNVIAGFLNLGPNAKVDDSTRKQWQSAFGDVVTPIVREKKLPDGTKVHGLILPSTGHWTLISPEVYGKIQAELASRVPKAGAKSGPGPTAVGVGRAIGSGVRTAAELPLRARAAAITAIPAAARAVGSTVSDVGSGITQGFTDGAQQAVPTR
jgi:hypothetical protein